MLNAIQALIFSILTLMFITLAIESHHEEEGHVAEDVSTPSTASHPSCSPRSSPAARGAAIHGPMIPGRSPGE